MDGASDFRLKVLVDGDVCVMRAIVDISQLHLADPGANAGDMHAVFGVQLLQLRELIVVQVNNVADCAAAFDVHESGAVPLQADPCERRHLLDGGLSIGGFIGKGTDDNGGLRRHGVLVPTAWKGIGELVPFLDAGLRCSTRCHRPAGAALLRGWGAG